jgi:hypothetical protein
MQTRKEGETVPLGWSITEGNLPRVHINYRCCLDPDAPERDKQYINVHIAFKPKDSNDPQKWFTEVLSYTSDGEDHWMKNEKYDDHHQYLNSGVPDGR